MWVLVHLAKKVTFSCAQLFQYPLKMVLMERRVFFVAGKPGEIAKMSKKMKFWIGFILSDF